MKHISLFSGIGGFDLASEWMGWQNVASCEINQFGNKVLQYYWPNAYHHDDIKTLTYEKLNQELTTRFGADWHSDDIILTGGFPCQDASIAKQHGEGQRGIQGDRTGLVYEMLRIIQEVKPRYVVAENVANILNTNNGRDWWSIINKLGRLGYSAEWRVCRASEVGACHHRSRCYLVAYPESFRFFEGKSFFTNVVEAVQEGRRLVVGTTSSVWSSWDSQPSIHFVDDGISERLDRITFPKWRNESIKAAGNAIVPQLVYLIFKAIEQYEQNLNSIKDRESECKFGFYSCTNAQYGFCDSCDEGSNYEIWDIADTYGSSLQCRNGQTKE